VLVPDAEARITLSTFHGTVLSLVVLVAPAVAQPIDWRTRVTLYGDNTEFFTPYRTGETILGGQFTSIVAARPSRRNEVQLGVFADHRFGSEAFADSVKPIIAFRHATTHSLGVVGTLETVRRHGLLDPVMVSTREITTPIEYGLQWRERRKYFAVEAWINWQKLNTSSQREQFELGAVLSVRPTGWLTLAGQHLWSHRGGQLFDAGVTVSNNRVSALGARLAGDVSLVKRASIAAFHLWSDGHLAPEYPAGRPGKGSGNYFRAGVAPWRWTEFFVVHWRGRDFAADAGDPNYGSAGLDSDFYRSRRRYTEIGALRRASLQGGVQFDTEVRFHRIDDENSIAFFGTPWELSYRVLVRVPVDLEL